jgi:RNA polymerase sigma-70 factor (ECF subfamily)
VSADFKCLLARAQAGDERAFRQLVDPYRRPLHVHCYRMLGSPQDAEDLTQETLLRAWRNIERFEPRVRIQTWLYRIATNACLDEIERRQRRPESVAPFPDDIRDHGSGTTYDPAARYALREGMELALLRAIQLLPGRQRAVLILRDVLGWTAPEVADLLESTVAGVNSALQRARATVDQNLDCEPRGGVGAEERTVLADYVAAFERDDVDGLIALLREDAVLRMPPQPSVLGAAAIVQFQREVASHGDLRNMQLTPTSANGRPAVVVHERLADGGVRPHGLLLLEIDAGQVTAIDAFIDPSLVPRFTRLSFAP